MHVEQADPDRHAADERLVGAIVDVVGRASVGDLGARVELPPADVPDARGPLELLANAVNLLLADLEQRQAAKEAAVLEAAAARARDEFLTNMSHEIRTPMNAVIGMTDLLTGTSLDAEQQEYVATIRAAGDHLLALIDDILDFSKIEARKVELEAVPVDVLELAEACTDIVAALAAEKPGLELAHVVAADVPPVLGDPARLRQILLNLLSNAVKFTDRGSVVLEVGAAPVAGGRVELRATVRDTGIGIAEDHLDRLFRPFSQADTSTTRRYGGTGLGLVISLRLAEAMGGGVRVRSTAGEGSAFTLVVALPVAPDPEGARPLEGVGVHVAHPLEPARRHLEQLALRLGATPVPDAAGADVSWVDEAAGQALGDRPWVAICPLRSGRRPRAAAVPMPVRHAALVRATQEVLGTAAGDGAAPEPGDAPAPVRALRLLVAEDNPVNQRVARALLGKQGHEVDLVETGLQALEAVGRERYDVVLMDVQMPEMDGLEATRRIRQAEEGGGRHVPVVAMTANALAGDRERCLAAGMDDYVSKPVRADELAAVLARWSPAGPADG